MSRSCNRQPTPELTPRHRAVTHDGAAHVQAHIQPSHLSLCDLEPPAQPQQGLSSGRRHWKPCCPARSIHRRKHNWVVK
eukprot:49450-Rhodomonas_salina.1